MSAPRASSLTLQSDAFGARPFRLALAFALAISAATIAAFALIYLAVSRENVSRISIILVNEARLNADAPDDRLRAALDVRLTREIRRIDYLALFDAKGALTFGNIARLPPIKTNGRAYFRSAAEMQEIGAAPESAILVARRRADGGILLFGRNLQDAHDVEATLLRALALALLPTVAVILAIGALFARRASRRLANVHEAIARIMQGHLHSRLPAAADGDEIDRIAHAVNLMLDEIERLLDQLKSVGDNIAHDLRAPLDGRAPQGRSRARKRAGGDARATGGRARPTRSRGGDDCRAAAHFRGRERPARQAFPGRRPRRDLRAGGRTL